MQLGQVVDFVIAYNERNKHNDDTDKKPKKRMATQAEIDAYFG